MTDNALKALIRKTETGKTAPADQYNTIIGHKEKLLPKPVTEMTVDEIIDASDKWRKQFGTTSGAAGAYQIIKPTLASLKRERGMNGSEKFNRSIQDEMADQLLRSRGFGDFVEGHMTVEAFGNNLAKEWASFPCLSAQTRGKVTLKRGQSYYDKVAGNSALIKPETVEATLLLLRSGSAMATPQAPPAAPIPVEPPVVEEPRPAFSALDWVIGAVAVAIIIGIALFALFVWPR